MAIIVVTLLALLSVAALALVWFFRGRDEGLRSAEIPATPASVEDTRGSEDSDSTLEKGSSNDSGSDRKAVEKIIAEIEETPPSDESAIDSEYTAESMSLMEGTAVVGQLGTGYDETSE